MSFPKEWRETIAPSHDEVFQLREVRRAVPPKIQPDLKNLRTMDEVWATLDEEFGQIMENVSGLVRGLVAFKYSKEAKDESSRFMELWRKWNEVYADLHELGKTSVLNHEPTIAAVGNMLPSNSSKDRYIELRLRRLEQGYDELQIMTEFMQAKKKRQKAKERMGTSDNSSNWSRQDPNLSHGTHQQPASSIPPQPGIPCPACNLHHTHISPKGETMYRTRLSSCNVFQNLSIEDKTAVVERSNICTLCLDWTVTHSKDTCDSRVRGELLSACKVWVNGVECGKKHNMLLHRSTAAICNVVRSKAMPSNRPNYQAPSKEQLELPNSSKITLLPIQEVMVEGQGKVCNLLYDSGSNINLVRHAYVKELGLPGSPVS